MLDSCQRNFCGCIRILLMSTQFLWLAYVGLAYVGLAYVGLAYVGLKILKSL